MQERKNNPKQWFQSLSTPKKVMVIGGMGLVIGVIIFALVYQSGDDGVYIAEDDTREEKQLVGDAEEDSKETAHDNTQPLTEEEQAIQDEYDAKKEDDYKKIVDGKIVDGDEATENDSDSDSNSSFYDNEAGRDKNTGSSDSKDDSSDSENRTTFEETADYDPGSEGFTKGGNLANEDFDRMDTPSDASYQHPTSYTKSDLEDMIDAFYSATLYPITEDNKEAVMNDMRAIMTTNLYESYFPGGEPDYIESGEREVSHSFNSIELAKNHKVGDDFVELVVVYNYGSIPPEGSGGQLVYTERAESVTFSLIDGEYRITGITA